MATKQRKPNQGSDNRPPNNADNVPPPYPREDHGFEFQALFDLKQSIGELKASMDALTVSVNSTKAKVEDLVNWKNKILGGAFVLGAVITVFGFLIGKFSSYVTIAAPAAVAPTPTTVNIPAQPASPPQSPAAVQKPTP